MPEAHDPNKPAPCKNIPEEADERPWEQPGAVRRDCEPGRGQPLTLLAACSIVFGSLAFCTFWSGFLGLAFGIPAWLLARHDLRKMDAGLMYPGERGQTRQAQNLAFTGILLSILGMLFCGLPLLLYQVLSKIM